GSVDMNRILEHDLSELPGESFLQTHCTNPLLRPETIDSAARRLAASPGHDSAFGVTRLQTRLYDGSGAPLNHDPDDLVRTQDLRPVFEENSNLYLFSRSSFESAGGRIGRRPIMIEIDRLEAIDIDDEATWAMAEAAFAALRPQEAAT
ncbi:MAG: acylneuraminate cytidylyltransferase family protein, partial [Planctomycetota bacterium]